MLFHKRSDLYKQLPSPIYFCNTLKYLNKCDMRANISSIIIITTAIWYEAFVLILAKWFINDNVIDIQVQ